MDFKTPWWNKYRKRRYKSRNYLTMEMIVRRSFVETFKEYIDSSSIAGLKRIFDSENSILQRFVWTAILFSSFGIVIYFLQYTWVSTLTKPLVVTGESFTYPIKDIDFPAVALCNINRISRKALKKWTLITYPKLARFNMTLTNLEYFYQDMGRLIDFNYDGMGPHFKLLEGFSISEFSEHIVEFMKVLAPSCEEMLIKCMWKNQVVDCNSTFHVRRTILGHCCVFNYVLDYESADSPSITTAPVKTQIVPGLNNGLRVIIDPMLEDYAYPLTYMTGFEILLFDPTHFPDMTGGRVIQRSIQPKEVVYFKVESIKQVAAPEVRKYPWKSRKCLFRDEYAKEFMNMYSYSACLVKCRIQSVQSLCKCTPYFFPSGVPTSTPVCTLKNLKCLDKYKQKLQYLYPFSTEGTQGLEQELADSLYCPACLPDCELTQHFVRSNKIPFHQKKRGFQNDFVRGVNLTNKCIINIFRQSTGGVLHRLDVVAYWFEILSNIGGFAGMLMGIGIYTIVEIIYFFFIRFVQAIYLNYSKFA